MLIRQAQANISTIRYYERTDLLSTFSRRLDVFGVPYGHVESGPAPDSRWQVSADDSDLVSIPLGSMPLLCLDGGEVAAVLLGAMTPINVGRKRGVRDGLPSALLERLFGLSMAALRGLHPHELLFRLYRLLDVQSDECAVNKGISEDMICSLDQLRSLLSAHGEDASGGGMPSDALMARLTMVAKHVSVFASSCINHIRGAQFRHIDRCALLWSIRQQQLFHDVSGKIPVLSADNRIIDASSEETSVQSMLDLVLSAVRSGSAAGLSVVLKMLPGHPGTLVPRESLLKQPDDDEWPILPCVASISSTAFGRANAKLIWRIWCAAAAAPNIEIIKVLIAAGWEMGYLYDSERADETSVSDVSASGMASEGRDPALRRAVALLEYGGTSLDWSVLHSAYCGVEKASQAIDATRIISLLSSERRIVSRQHARHRARELLSSMSLINSPAMWLWHFTCPVSGGAESSEEAVFDIAAALGDWAVIKDIMSADSFIAILHYCTRFRRCDRLSSTDCRSPLMHYAMLDQRADIIGKVQ